MGNSGDALSGGAQGAVGGATLGAQVGGPYGAAVGAIIGGAVGIIGGFMKKKIPTPSLKDLTPSALRFLDVDNKLPGGAEFAEANILNVQFLRDTLSGKGFETIEQRGAAGIARGFRAAEDIDARASASGFGPQRLQSANSAASTGIAEADFYAQLEPVKLAAKFQAGDRVFALDQFAAQIRAMKWGMKFKTDVMNQTDVTADLLETGAVAADAFAAFKESRAPGKEATGGIPNFEDYFKPAGSGPPESALGSSGSASYNYAGGIPSFDGSTSPFK